MHDRKRRFLWTLAAILLPGPWTPVIVLLYALRRAEERAWDMSNTNLVVDSSLGPNPYSAELLDHKGR